MQQIYEIVVNVKEQIEAQNVTPKVTFDKDAEIQVFLFLSFF